MGFFKKIFKPVSKVLDKIIPNEIKPALPYLAAFAPMFGPTSSLMGKGIMQRALISGGLNIGAQLAQEGNEGEINALSAGLGALTGAMTAPDASNYFNMRGDLASEGTGIISKAKQFGFETLGKGSDIMAAGADKGLFSKEGLKAATLPASVATGDVMQAEARRLEKQQAIDDALAQAELLADSGARADAIRNAMTAYGFFTDDEIEDTIFSAGYRAGGRVGFKNAGLAGLTPGQMDTESSIESSYEIDNKPIIIKFYSKEDSGRRNEAFYEIMDPITGSKSNISQEDYIEKYGEPKANGGRVGLRFGGIGNAVENIEDQEIKESAKFAMEDMDIPIMDLAEEFEIQFKRKPNSLEELKQFYKDRYEYKGPGDVKMKEEIKEKVVMEAKDGGRIGFDEGGDEGDGMLKEIAKIIFRLTPAGAGIMAADEAIEMYNNLSEEDKEKVQSFGKKAMRFAGIPGLAVSAGMELSEKFKEKEMKDGGLMNLGGKEMDLRGGGFVPIGKKERADDVPARLSKNEFVMTADAVRAAGGGSVNKGAKRMYEVMNKLEARA